MVKGEGEPPPLTIFPSAMMQVEIHNDGPVTL